MTKAELQKENNALKREIAELQHKDNFDIYEHYEKVCEENSKLKQTLANYDKLLRLIR